MVHAMREESVDIFVSVWTFLTYIMQTSGDLDPQRRAQENHIIFSQSFKTDPSFDFDDVCERIVSGGYSYRPYDRKQAFL